MGTIADATFTFSFTWSYSQLGKKKLHQEIAHFLISQFNILNYLLIWNDTSIYVTILPLNFNEMKSESTEFFVLNLILSDLAILYYGKNKM